MRFKLTIQANIDPIINEGLDFPYPPDWQVRNLDSEFEFTTKQQLHAFLDAFTSALGAA